MTLKDSRDGCAGIEGKPSAWVLIDSSSISKPDRPRYPAATDALLALLHEAYLTAAERGDVSGFAEVECDSGSNAADAQESSLEAQEVQAVLV